MAKVSTKVLKTIINRFYLCFSENFPLSLHFVLRLIARGADKLFC